MVTDKELFFPGARRVELLTLGIGFMAALCAGFLWGIRVALTVGAGATLSWLNLHWLTGGVMAISPPSRTREGENAKVHEGALARFIGRYALLFAVAYVILTGFKLPAIALVAGLFAPVAAVMAAAVWHLAQTAFER
jgi:hypothetical protein